MHRRKEKKAKAGLFRIQRCNANIKAMPYNQKEYNRRYYQKNKERILKTKVQDISDQYCKELLASELRISTEEANRIITPRQIEI